MYCEYCGKQIADDSVFCEYCGKTQTPSSTNETPIVTGTSAASETPAHHANTALIILAIAAVVTLIFAVVIIILLWNPSEGTDTPAETPTTESTAAPENSDPVMPSLVGKTREEATAALKELGVTPHIEEVYDENAAADTIIAQTPDADTVFSLGDAVTLTVSLGRDPACPYEYSQKVTVEAAPGSSNATLTLYEWDEGDWKQLFSCSATVGSNGIDAAYGEGTKRTPLGTFPLGVALTADSLNNTQWPVYYVTSDTCVVDDTSSPYYNTIQSISSLPSYVHYDAIGQTILNGFTSTALYIEHNGDGYSSAGVVRGKGSLITLCGRNGNLSATAGCIDIRSSDMNALLGLLDYEQNPHIETKVKP